MWGGANIPLLLLKTRPPFDLGRKKLCRLALYYSEKVFTNMKKYGIMIGYSNGKR